MEIWKEIEGYEGLYEVSNLGNVKSLISGKILKPQKHNRGYLMVGLYKQRKCKFYKIHRLVSEAFLPNPNNYEEVNHIDEDKTNNIVDNLEWCTRSYNVNYSQSKQVMCVEKGKIYTSTHQVEIELGFSHSHISSACNGKLKQAYGYTWRYV